MAIDADPLKLAGQVRRLYLETLLSGVPSSVQAVVKGANHLANQKADPATAYRLQNVALDLVPPAPAWEAALAKSLKSGPATPLLLRTLASESEYGPLKAAPGSGPDADEASDLPELTLVEDETIETEILSSRLAQSFSDKAAWEFSDLSARVCSLEQCDELVVTDLLRPHVVACAVVESWAGVGLPKGHWQALEKIVHSAFGDLVAEAYHEGNRFLLEQGVLPEIDLRPRIRRAVSSLAPLEPEGGADGAQDWSLQPRRPGSGEGGDDTRVMTTMGHFTGGRPPQGEGDAQRLAALMADQMPAFAPTAATQPPHMLRQAIAEAQAGLQERIVGADEAAPSMPLLLQDLQERKRALKQAASTPVERATIEIVALLFQSILTEDKIPAGLRVWFARLQMPVLRVAVSEPDFFATTDHPARRLIDRMGACVMGFDVHSRNLGNALDDEVKRVVQVVEAYPDTGRRVFQTVLNEFEKFLKNYFQNENDATRKGVSLAQQVEQRETLAIQYTIELRKMLNEMPVQDGVRNFLFHTWADVLAMVALRSGATSEAGRKTKIAAADLIWSVSAKVSREERAEVIRRLPPLLKTLREGMSQAGVSAERQDAEIKILNDALAAAFTAKSAAIPADRLKQLTGRLEDLEDLLPDAGDVEIDEAVVMDLSGHESSDLQVVTEGGASPTPAVLEWAAELQVGSWYMLELRGSVEPVQLVWQGMRKQLSLFVSQRGRGALFQKRRLAGFLQAGLLVPAQEESLTVRATRNALAKLEADPQRLLS
jgi:hypothetical protein